MTDPLDTIRDDHANLAKLFDVLEAQLAQFDRGGEPDYDIIQGIADYCLNYPDLYHHPLEDLLLQRLHTHDPGAALAVGDLEAEHEELRQEAQRFRDAVQQVLLEQEVSRGAFDHLVRDFMARYREHMRKENEVFLPAVAGALSPQDRAEVATQAGPRHDPLFGASAEARYEALRDKLMRWAREAS